MMKTENYEAGMRNGNTNNQKFESFNRALSLMVDT